MRLIIEGGFAVIISLFLISSFLPQSSPKMIDPVSTVVVKPQEPSVANLPNQVLAAETATNPQPVSVNVLLLGLDARIGDARPRCDAIQMISFNRKQNQIIITSVPRGTKVSIPGIDGSSAYLANACHYEGIPYAVTQIEKITKIHPDFVVKAGFSQTLGILRHLGLPTTPTLEFLRNRKFAVGDYQRSHDQALFLKEMMIKELARVATLPKPLQYVLFKTLDTDMTFDTASQYLEELNNSGVTSSPDNIVLSMKPSQPGAVTDSFSLPENSTVPNPSDPDFQSYQQTVINNIQGRVTRTNALLSNGQKTQAYKNIQTLFSQHPWLQIEDADTRNESHYQILTAFVNSSSDQKTNASLLLDFITEMEIAGDDKLKSEAQQLLQTISAN